MINREEIIQNYISGYNQFDVLKMIRDMDENVVFENIQNGSVTMSLVGLAAFKNQAEEARAYFKDREQTVRSIKHTDNRTEVEIDYRAVLAMDLPGGLQSGQELNMKGKSVFEFLENKIVKLSDIS